MEEPNERLVHEVSKEEYDKEWHELNRCQREVVYEECMIRMQNARL